MLSSILKRSMRGFTLIELLVVLGIVFIFLAAGFVSFRKTIAQQLLPNEGLKLVSNLRKVQTASTTGNKPSTGCTTLLGYEIEFISSTSTYRMRPDCDTPIAWSNINATTYTLPSGITLLTNPSSSPTTTMRFKVLSQGVTNPYKICLQDSKQQKKYEILVTGTGEVRALGITSVNYSQC